MFSAREREYLAAVARWKVGRPRRLRLSPGHRRKLEWGIRRKTRQAAEDWALYARALQRNPRILLAARPGQDGTIPTYTEPFAAALEHLTSALGKLGRTGPRAPRQRGGDRRC